MVYVKKGIVTESFREIIIEIKKDPKLYYATNLTELIERFDKKLKEKGEKKK